MAEEAKQPFDPDATVRQPSAAIATDPEDTVRGPVFDPDATVNPAARVALEDPEATIRIPSPGKRKKNPFAPHALPESLQANLSALGGVNPLVALANPVLGAVPQIRRALKHPDPERLRERLREQIEALETSAMSADIPDKAVYLAVYALCALLDESAASTPWGRDWIENGLLHELRDTTEGGEGFFTQLEGLAADPDDNADLIEFFYICMALGFEGRYRGAEGGRHELERVRDRIYALISRRRPRPRDGLSERWRSARGPQAPAQPAPAPTPPAQQPIARLRGMPLRAKLSATAAIVGTLLVAFIVSTRFGDEAPPGDAAAPAVPASAAPQAQPPRAAAPAQPAAEPDLAKMLGDVARVSEKGGVLRIEPRNERQFASGAVRPSAALQKPVGRIAQSLDRVSGAIVVIGHADSTPVRRTTNQALSLARARAVALMLSAALADPKRVSAEGRADSEPAAPNDSAANRARNRRVVIEVRRAP
jgi:type VI secretion system protein ImpK